MLNSLTREYKLFYSIYYSLLELLGDEKADEIFNSAGLDPFDKNAPDYFRHGSELLEKISLELCARYGEETTRGLLIRMGNASITFFRKYFSDIARLGSIDNRLKPIDRRFSESLNSLADVLSREMGLSINVIVKSPRNFDWQFYKLENGSPATTLSAYFYFGLLEEFCSWLDARKNYLLNFTACENYQNKRSNLN